LYFAIACNNHFSPLVVPAILEISDNRMQSFISETLERILQQTKTFDNVVFVLPSQRAGVFVKKELKSKLRTGFLPEVQTIEQFIETVTGLQKTDTVALLFHFYGIYKTLEPNPDSFDVFASWAFTVLQDFNEIDQHLVNTQDIFVYLRDIERLRKWSVTAIPETPLMKAHFSFLEKLRELHEPLYQFLLKNKQGYQGLIYREATKKIAAFSDETSHKKYFFMGFNALNKAEEFLFQEMLAGGNTEIYWDIDSTFLHGNHQAGRFIRDYKANWTYYQQNKLQTVGNWFAKEKNIRVLGASKNITQIKQVGLLLEQVTNQDKTALVLADESLLPIALNSLPKNIEAVNITMGYPLKDIPLTSLFSAIFELFLNQKKLQKTADKLFYHKEVFQFFNHTAIQQLLLREHTSKTSLQQLLLLENNTFISQENIQRALQNYPKETQETLSAIFQPYTTIDAFLETIIALIAHLKEQVTTLEKEYLFRYYTAFIQLKTLQADFHYFQDLQTVAQFFKQLIRSQTISFQGEPLQGLQIMGVLETRVLDFENIILTSVNEGIIPASSSQHSFIPFDVKVQFGLPTYKEKDAVFSYHFFRLIQRAKNISILYNTENDVYGSGEKSRFIAQLERLKEKISYEIVSPKVAPQSQELKEISKTADVLLQLDALAEKGISPSAISSYLNNPIRFYFQKVLHLKEFKNIEETIAANTMGTVVHHVLEKLYLPYIGEFVTETAVKDMQLKAPKYVQEAFAEHFKNGDIQTGKNRLIYEVSKRFIANFLSQEQQSLESGKNTLQILALEQSLHATIPLQNTEKTLRIHGNVDRIDKWNGVTRIIDYKAGNVASSQLKMATTEGLNDYKYHKGIQLMLYAFLFTKSEFYTPNMPLEAGMYSFKNLQNGLLQMNFSSKKGGKDSAITSEKLAEFMQQMGEIFEEIYNKDIPFAEPVETHY